jgi:hypothetical protein
MRLVLLLAACGLTACASMDSAECRSANWYDLGFRDAIFGLQPQDSTYSALCGRHNVALDTQRYSEGWRHGHYEHEQRLGMSLD